MKNSIFLLEAVVIFLLVGNFIIINCSTMPQKSIKKPIVNTWSELTNGLSGRLRVEFEDLKPGLRHAVYLELKNHTLNPVAVINQPEIHAELFDSAGKSVSTSGFPIDGPILNPQWAVIPRYAYIGFRIDLQIVGVPTREHGMALMAVGGKTWGLKAGKYVLEIALVFKKKEDAPPNQWVGELELPPVEFVVTTQMLAVN